MASRAGDPPTPARVRVADAPAPAHASRRLPRVRPRSDLLGRGPRGRGSARPSQSAGEGRFRPPPPGAARLTGAGGAERPGRAYAVGGRLVPPAEVGGDPGPSRGETGRCCREGSSTPSATLDACRTAPARASSPPTTVRFCPLCGGSLVREAVPPDQREHAVCSRCRFVFYLNPKLVAATIPEQEGRVLLTRRSIDPGRGLWTFPGGFVDYGETVDATQRCGRRSRRRACSSI